MTERTCGMTPIFDRLVRERGFTYLPRPIGTLDRPRLLTTGDAR